MLVSSISLNNFRNYSNILFKPHPSINVISGPNAQGKTNLLESIYYCLRGRSFRAERDRDIIKWHRDKASINADISLADRNVRVQWSINAAGKKLHINGSESPRSELDYFGVVLFSPEDLYLVKGSPQERRHFLDYDAGPLRPEYSQAFRQYARVLTQRNSLLKEIRDKRSSQEMLELWDEQLFRYGAKLIFLRLQVLSRLIPLARSIHSELTSGTEEFQAKYLSSLVLEQGMTEDNINRVFASTSKQVRSMEVQRCQTLMGPHRDDLSLSINGIEARSFGSQGQQRTITLSLKIAQLEMWYREFGYYPILLLDDVLFELDHKRQTMLLDRVANRVQTFITTCSDSMEEFIRGTGAIWHIQAGSLVTKE